MVSFEGTYTALVTPFRNGEIDVEAFLGLLRRQTEAGVRGVVPCGCTGEAATLSREERRRLIELALETVGDTLQVVPGTGTNSTTTSIELTREAESAGAHAAMLITPYYNKPSQQGLVEHYRRVADATTIPLVLYNVPSRTGVTLSPATIATLHETGRYGALKEAGGSIDAVSNIRRASPITILSGDDSLTLPMMSLGARGVVSVVSNLYPRLVAEMVSAVLEGDYERARTLHFGLMPVMRAAFVESNPSPMKAMLSIRGLMQNELRPPLVPVSEPSLAEIRLALEAVDGARSVTP